MAANPRDRVDELSAPDPFEVRIDAKPYPRYGDQGEMRWEYNAAANAIDFDPPHAPPPGSTLTVSYRIACSSLDGVP